MAISNRDLDASEQKKAFSVRVGGSADGTTLALLTVGYTTPFFVVPFSSELRALQVAGFGLSAAPTGELRNYRFIPGSGFTAIAGLASSMIVPAFGVSGQLSASLAAQGSTILQLLAGDILTWYSGTSNAACNAIQFGIVLKALQDIKADFGVTT